MRDPAIPLNCPYCGARIEHERTEGETHYYRCPRCRPLALPPDGRLRRVHVGTSTRPV
jgi:tRNA(Ile2) C34 agmatinyltransferase TiaS